MYEKHKKRYFIIIIIVQKFVNKFYKLKYFKLCKYSR